MARRPGMDWVDSREDAMVVVVVAAAELKMEVVALESSNPSMMNLNRQKWLECREASVPESRPDGDEQVGGPTGWFQEVDKREPCGNPSRESLQFHCRLRSAPS